MFNNKLIALTKITLKFSYGLLILVSFSQFVYADVEINNLYQLPPSKLQMEHCQREALLLHSGKIEQERIFHQQNSFWIRYDIQANDHSEWSVLCDLTTGKIVHEQRQIDNKF